MNNMNRDDVKKRYVDNYETLNRSGAKRIAIEDHEIDKELGLATGYTKDHSNSNDDILDGLRRN